MVTCSALQNSGIPEIWDKVEKYKSLTQDNGFFFNKRHEQSTYWMHETIEGHLKSNFYQNPEIKEKLKEMELNVLNNKISSFVAAGKLLKMFSKLK